jgi:peptidyl-prolyl cis-trans isomerase C
VTEETAAQRSLLSRAVREPLLIFLAAGIGLYALYAGIQRNTGQAIFLTAASRAELIESFETVAGRPATAADIARIEQEFITDEVLFRAALDEDLHLTDSTVRAKLIEEMRFRITGMLPDPTDEQLVNHYAEHLDLYRSEPAVTFRHVYFQARPANAAELLAQLRAGRPVEGESFDQGREFPRFGRSLLRGLFGQPFTEALWQAPLEDWTGPLQSTRGWHFVLPTERLPRALLPFDAVRQQVENDYLRTLIDSAVDKYVEQHRQRYDVQVER